MHEIGVVRSMVKTVTDFAQANGIAEVTEIVLDIGELSLVIPKYVEDIYPVVVEDTFLKDTKLIINVIPGMAECDECNELFNVIEHEGYCPNCGRQTETSNGTCPYCGAGRRRFLFLRGLRLCHCWLENPICFLCRGGLVQR